MDPPAEAGLKNLKFQFLANLDNSFVTFIIPPHQYLGIILFKSYTALIPTLQFHQQQLQHRPQIFILEPTASSCPCFSGRLFNGGV